MNSVSGDLITLTLAGQFDVIIHGCNCFCTMEGGIAKKIQEEFPEAYSADIATTKGERKKLGTYSATTVVRNGHRITIVNGYTQYHYSGAKVLVDYWALRQLFVKMKTDFGGKRLGYPKIGAGLAGGDWQKIAAIIDEELAGENHTLVLYAPLSHHNTE